jgi:hypothetical protein
MDNESTFNAIACPRWAALAHKIGLRIFVGLATYDIGVACKAVQNNSHD